MSSIGQHIVARSGSVNRTYRFDRKSAAGIAENTARHNRIDSRICKRPALICLKRLFTRHVEVRMPGIESHQKRRKEQQTAKQADQGILFSP